MGNTPDHDFAITPSLPGDSWKGGCVVGLENLPKIAKRVSTGFLQRCPLYRSPQLSYAKFGSRRRKDLPSWRSQGSTSDLDTKGRVV